MLLPLSRVDSESSRRALTLAADDISRVALFERVPTGFTVVGSFCVLALHAAPPLAALVAHDLAGRRSFSHDFTGAHETAAAVIGFVCAGRTERTVACDIRAASMRVVGLGFVDQLFGGSRARSAAGVRFT